MSHFWSAKGKREWPHGSLDNIIYIGAERPEYILDILGMRNCNDLDWGLGPASSAGGSMDSSVKHFLMGDSWDMEMGYLHANGTATLGDSDFDALGFDGVISTKSLYYMATNSDYDIDQWKIDDERQQQGDSVTKIAKEVVGVKGFPRLAFRTSRVKRKEQFLGAHDPVNDAAMTLLNAIGCAIRYAADNGIMDGQGNPISWDSIPPVLSTSAWHIASVDAEGASVPGKTVLSEWGTVHLRSVDVEGVPYRDWWKKFRCSILVVNKYQNVVNPFCPRPPEQFLWWNSNTIRRVLPESGIGPAILADFIKGFTCRHYHGAPDNVRVAKAKVLTPATEQAPPVLSPVPAQAQPAPSSILERDLGTTHTQVALKSHSSPTQVSTPIPEKTTPVPSPTPHKNEWDDFHPTRAGEAMASSVNTSRHVSREIAEFPKEIRGLLPGMLKGICPESLNAKLCASAQLKAGIFCQSIHICHVYKKNVIDGGPPCPHDVIHFTRETMGDEGPLREVVHVRPNCKSLNQNAECRNENCKFGHAYEHERLVSLVGLRQNAIRGIAKGDHNVASRMIRNGMTEETYFPRSATHSTRPNEFNKRRAEEEAGDGRCNGDGRSVRPRHGGGGGYNDRYHDNHYDEHRGGGNGYGGGYHGRNGYGDAKRWR